MQFQRRGSDSVGGFHDLSGSSITHYLMRTQTDPVFLVGIELNIRSSSLFHMEDSRSGVIMMYNISM